MHSNRRWTGSGGETWNCSGDEQAQHWKSFALLTIYLRNCGSQSGAAPICSRERVRNGDDSVVVLRYFSYPHTGKAVIVQFPC